MLELKVETATIPEGVIVKVIGDAGVPHATELDRHLLSLQAGRPRLTVFDLSELTFISSLGMGTLMGYQRGVARYGGVTRFAGLKPLVQEAFKRARLDLVCPMYPTVEEATSAAMA